MKAKIELKGTKVEFDGVTYLARLPVGIVKTESKEELEVALDLFSCNLGNTQYVQRSSGRQA